MMTLKIIKEEVTGYINTKLNRGYYKVQVDQLRKQPIFCCENISDHRSIVIDLMVNFRSRYNLCYCTASLFTRLLQIFKAKQQHLPQW